MNNTAFFRFFGLLGILTGATLCGAATVDITELNTPYDSATMKGNTLNIAAGTSLVTDGTTYPVATSCTLTGSGNWIVNNSGNVYYTGNDGTDANPKVAPTLSDFTGTIYLGNVNTRWMAASQFYSQFNSCTIDVKGESQVWISGGNTVNAHFNLHDPLTTGHAGVGSIRFDGMNSQINGNITLATAGKNFVLCVRYDHRTATNTINGIIDGAGNLQVDSKSSHYDTHSTLKLTGANTYTGTTSVVEGVLEVSGAGTLGTGAITVNVNNGTFDDGDEAHKGTYKRDDGVLKFSKTNDYTLTQTLSGTGFVEQNGTSNLTFSGSVSGFTGTLTQTAGTLTFADNATALGTGSTVNLSGGTLNMGTLTDLGTFNFAGGTITPGAAPASATAVNVNGGSVSYNTLASTFTLPTGSQISLNEGGKLTAATTTELNALNSNVLFNGGEVAINEAGFVIDQDMTFPVSTEFTQATVLNVPTTKTATLTVTNAADMVKFSAGLGESAEAKGQNLVKEGAGMLEINGSTFTGNATVNAGTLSLTGTGNGVGTITVAKDASVRVTNEVFKATKKPIYSGAGTLYFDTASRVDCDAASLNVNNFTGNVVFGENSTEYIRAILYGNLSKFDKNTLTFKNGSQLHVGSNGNFQCSLILSGDTSSYENRGAVRFDNVFGTNAGSVLTGNVTLADETLVTVRKDTGGGWGMFSGPISGTGSLTLGALSNTEAVLVLTGANTYSGDTQIGMGTVQLGYTGTINGTIYNGDSGTLGTGKMTVGSGGALAYNRTDTVGYNFMGGVDNDGTVNVKSGKFITSTEAVTNKKTWNVQADATYESNSDFTNTNTGTFTNAGTLNITGGVFTNAGSLVNNGTFSATGGSLSNTNTFTNALGATANIENDFTNTNTFTNALGAIVNIGNDFTNTGTFTNAGTLNITGGTFQNNGALNYTGTMNVKDGAVMNVSFSPNGTGDGMLNVENGGVLNIASTAKNFSGKVNLLSGGKLALANSPLTQNAVITGTGTMEITVTEGPSSSTFANVSDFEGNIRLITQESQKGRLMFSAAEYSESNAINLGEKATLQIVSSQLYLKNYNFTGNIQLYQTSQYADDSATTYAGIRTDSGTSKLYGTLELMDAETWIAAQNSGNNFYIYSEVSGVGGLVKHDVDSSSTIYLAGDTHYAGKTKVNAGTLAIGDGTNAARMQANDTISLDRYAKLIVNPNGVLSVGNDTDTTGKTLAIETGLVNIDGTLELSVFSADDYDHVDFTGLNSLDTTDATLFLDMEDADFSDAAVYQFDWATALGNNTFANVLLSDRYAGWIATMGANGVVTFGSASALPEPATWTLLLLGFGMFLRRRKNNQ